MFSNIPPDLGSRSPKQEDFSRFDQRAPLNLSPVVEPTSEDKKLNELKSKLKSG